MVPANFPDEECPDFAITEQLLRFRPRHREQRPSNGEAATKRSTPDTVPASFFIAGNATMHKRYGDKFPWRADAAK